jgi:MSHA biogenesis protein MshO
MARHHPSHQHFRRADPCYVNNLPLTTGSSSTIRIPVMFTTSKPNREQISAIATPATGAAEEAIYRHRITLNAAKQFPLGYDGGRFMIVANSEQSVFFNCVAGKLYRTSASFSDGAGTCSSTGALLATDIESCTFTYDVGATEQSAFVWMELKLKRADERITLAHGTHVDNVP